MSNETVELDTVEKIAAIPIEQIDVSRPSLFQKDTIGLFFDRLRKEDPVHYCPESNVGPYWSITKYNDIVAVDSNHKVFSSDRDIVIGDAPADFNTPMFIAMDGQKHVDQRKAASPAVAPSQLADIEALKSLGIPVAHGPDFRPVLDAD